jgi:hypothetical protein
MLRDEDFSKNAAVDRYGRKLRRDDAKRHLEKFYRLDENQDDDNHGSEGNVDDKEVHRELQRVEKIDYDPARDGGFASSSSDEESSSEEAEEGLEEPGAERELPDRRSDVPMGEVTRRLAVVNLDWDNIRAEDLMAVCSSFLPAGGLILKISVYPSEFGRERMEREEVEGPPKEVFSNWKHELLKNDDSDPASEDPEEESEKIKQSLLIEDQGEEFDSAHLRRYQLERLRYYYAVMTCSSEGVAKHIYDAVDGTEYMASANFFDLRFVPDNVDFTDDTPRDECESVPDGYKPNEFITDALQHSKVKLTWDADDSARKEAQARAFRGGRKEIDENDLKAYLCSGSSEEDEEEAEVVDAIKGYGKSSKLSKKEAGRERMRCLLGFTNKPSTKPKATGPVGDMEITFSAGLSGVPATGNVFENEPKMEETTRESYVRKERERKRRRKARLKAARNGETLPEDGQGAAKEAEGTEKEDLGFDDPFFKTPQNDTASANAQRKEERRKKREERAADEAASAAQRAELELLMVDDKSIPVKHFYMSEIEKAEKMAQRAQKRHKKGQKNEAEMKLDDFKMDVHDPRFQRLWDSHEFAIDPTNPRFKGTKGMKELLEEGRKRRRQCDARERGIDKPGKKKKSEPVLEKPDESGELNKLVERVKGKGK